MNDLRLTLAAVVLTSLWIAGCEAKGETTDVPMRDSGPGPSDAGPGRDSGPGQGQCPAGVCNLVTGAGCASGQGCYWTTSIEEPTMPSRPLCYPAGPRELGEDGCEAINDCAAGLFCLRLTDGTGICVEYCCGGNSGTCDTGTACIAQLIDATDQAGNAYWCEADAGCNLLAQTGCDSGTNCYLTPGQLPGRICALPGTKSEGMTCIGGTECQPGFGCFETGTPGTRRCYKLCDDAGDCGGGSRQCMNLGYTHDTSLMPIGRCTPLPS